MSYPSKRFENIQADSKLGDVSIRQDTFVCHQVYDETVDFSMLYAHKPVEIGIIVSGSGIHKVLGQAIPCKAGDIYIINSNVPHRYFAAEEETGLTVRRLLFEPKDWFDDKSAVTTSSHFCYGVFSENPISVYAMLTNRVMQKIISLCDALAIEMLEKKSEWRNALKANLSLILITLKRYVDTSLKNVPNTDSVTWGPDFAAIAFVNENYGDANMTLETIAESFYISKSHLSRRFKQLTGTPFPTYLKNIRLAKACALLVDTNDTIDTIMKMCGMRDATSFYKAFGEYTGLTPNQYRKEKSKGENTMNILTEISDNLQKGKSKIVKELVQSAIDQGVDAETILTAGLLSGMSVIGEKFKNSEIYVPEVLVAARAMNAGVELLKPLLAANGVVAKGKVCIGTVQGDLHDIGKNLVKMMMEGKGLEVIDLGTDVAPETFINTAIEQNCQVICCSALLTTTMDVMDAVVKAATEAGIRDKVKIMVGGAPVNEEYCNKIGADCYTADATSAADAAVAFLQPAKLTERRLHMFTNYWNPILVRYEAFWERTNTDRPILNISYKKTNASPYRAPETPKEQWLDAEYKYHAYKAYINSTGFIAEGVPSAFTNFGPGCLSACIGGSFKLQPDTVWFGENPIVKDWENPPEIVFDETSEMWQAVVREQELFARDPDVLFSVTDLGGILDIVASLRGTQELLYDLYDYPDEVKEFIAKVKAAWNTAFAQQLETLKKAGLPYNAWMNIPSAKPWYPIQCDFCSMLSPQHFDEFVLPDIIDHANLMERSIYHLDGPGELTHIDKLLDIPNLNGIQWVSGGSNEPVWDEKWFDLYRKIQDSKKNLVLLEGISEQDLAGAERLIKSIDPAGTYISVSCSTREKAEDLFEKITRWSE